MNNNTEQQNKIEEENEKIQENKNFIERNKVFQFSEFIVSNKNIFQFVLLFGVLFEVYKIIFKYRLEKDWINTGISIIFILVYVFFINHMKSKNINNGGLEE